MYQCRICAHPQPRPFLVLGPTPLANSFRRQDQLDEPEGRFPLELVLCDECHLVQLNYVVPPEMMFRDYIYVSSTSTTIPAHFRAYADEVFTRFISSPEDLVLEIGSNDGCLLRGFPHRAVRTLGIEPASNIAVDANEKGVETLNDFFCVATAKRLLAERGPAKVIIGNNVLAHISDLRDAVSAVAGLLSSDGVAIFEAPYLVDLLNRREFDTIYHEHISYFSVSTLSRLLVYAGLRIFDVKKFAVHGGSIRVYACKEGSARKILPSVQYFLALEAAERLHDPDTYANFARGVLELKKELSALVHSLKQSGNSIAAYGAPAKGNTLLNYMGFDSSVIDFIVDKNPLKQGTYTPGTHIPIHGVERLRMQMPDYCLILAWNFFDEIREQQKEYELAGGKFILPLPVPRVVKLGTSVVI